MTKINDYLIQSELAMASYGSFSGNTIIATDLTNLSVGMSPSQATAFADKWQVAAQYNDPISGVSATVFEEIGTGIKHLAIRGTQSTNANDIVSATLLATGWPSNFNLQFIALKKQIEDVWLQDPAVLQGQDFTVTGHSLGGYLAEAVKSTFPQVTQGYLYNAPGVASILGNVADALAVQALYSPYLPDRKQSGWAFNGLKNPKFSLNINKYLRKLFFGIILTFFINQNAFCEKYNVNPAIDKDFVAWSNSMPKEEAVVQLKDFLSSFDSWEEAETWLISEGFAVISAEMSEYAAELSGKYPAGKYPAFGASASWNIDRQGVIFANGWFRKLELKIFVYAVSVGIYYTENGQFTVHSVSVQGTIL